MKLLLKLMPDDFINAIKANQAQFGVDLAKDRFEILADYYALVQEHNPILHLVGPCTPEEFAIRHILESLTLLEFLPKNARFADVGAGAGLPSMPCLIVRDDLKAVVIESKEKKAKFLEIAAQQLGIKDRVEIVNRQFEQADPANAEFITCRALDKFTEKLPRLLKWSKKRTLFLFGGKNLRDALQKKDVKFVENLMPMSEQRFLFLVSCPIR